MPLLSDGIRKSELWNETPIPAAPGKSLVPTLTSDITIPRDHLWWLHEGNRAVSIGDWKLVAARRGEEMKLNEIAGNMEKVFETP